MKILIIDIETTGFQNKGGKIVEVGIVELDLNNGDRKVLFDKVTYEEGITLDEVANSWVIANSDLTVYAIQHSTRLDYLLPEIQKIINDYPEGATAYNRAFDFNFLESRGIKFKKKLPCPMLLSTDYCKLPGPQGYKWPKVQECYDILFPNNDYVETHRGTE